MEGQYVAGNTFDFVASHGKAILEAGYAFESACSECFDGKLVSADVRLLKPQHEIFELLFETFSLRPEECFFIDDNAANIDGAFAVGMPGAVFFRDFARLRRELRAAGVSVKEQT